MEKNTLINFYKKYMLLVGTLGHAIFLFQAYEIYKNHSSQNVSLPGFMISYFSVISWLVYGYLIEEQTVFRVNLFGFVAGSTCIITILMFR